MSVLLGLGSLPTLLNGRGGMGFFDGGARVPGARAARGRVDDRL
jgi:hypothetical protein